MAETIPDTPSFATGSKYEVPIHDLAFGGEGVGKIGDFVVFVPFAIPGELVEVELTEVKKSYGRGRLVSVLKPSPDRVEPPCPYFKSCGGCQYQHIDYPAQLRFKHKQISDLFQRIGGFDRDVVGPIIGCPSPYGYRNRIMIRSQWNKRKQGLNIGFITVDNKFVEDIDHCLIADPRLNEDILRVRKNPPPKGGIKVVLRIAPNDWHLPPDSFFQNNFILLPQLVETVRSTFIDSGNRFLVDGYCGVGFFGIELAGQCEAFVGVELDRRAIQSARKNAEARGIEHGEFLEGRTEEMIPDLAVRYPRGKTTLILDPPRTGCPPEMLNALLKTPMNQIIYVSCHPATLARDLNILCRDKVFKLKKVTPLDMFPQTQHVECVADLRMSND